MKAVVFRTSAGHGSKHPPCPEAWLEIVPYIDWRNFGSLKEARVCLGEEWFAEGRDHREENRMVRRTLDNPNWARQWVIEIDNIWEFVKRIGESCIISYTNCFEGIEREIEIYDSLRK